jgi:hypothetical protein
MILRQPTVTFRFKMCTCISELFTDSLLNDIKKVKPNLLPQRFTSKFLSDSLIKDFLCQKYFDVSFTIYMVKQNFKVCFIDISVSSVVYSK